jgi:Fe-S-cluster containining protein
MEDQPLAAGAFSAWLVGMQRALRGEDGSDVPCGGCTACCTSSQFIHIGPDEAETLARIPAELLFPAPRMPRGNVLLGYDENGHCPMLIDGKCSIYEHRPRTCRTYDCRIFPAAGVAPDEDQLPIARQARRWRFDFPADVDRMAHDGVRAAARFVREHEELLPGGVAPANATQRAVLAIRLADPGGRPPEFTGR